MLTAMCMFGAIVLGLKSSQSRNMDDCGVSFSKDVPNRITNYDILLLDTLALASTDNNDSICNLSLTLHRTAI